MIAGIAFDPGLIIPAASGEHFFTEHRLAQHRAEKVFHLARARQTAQIAVDDDPIKTVIYKKKQAAKQLCKQFHRSSLEISFSSTKSSLRGSMESNFKYFWLVLRKISATDDTQNSEQEFYRRSHGH